MVGTMFWQALVKLLVAADLDFVPTTPSLFLRPSLTSLASYSEFNRFFTFLEMADLALEVVLEFVLTKAVSLAAEEITLAWGVDKELNKLAEKLKTIQALLSDAQRKQLTSEFVQDWLERLGSASLDAQIVLDDFGYKVLRQKVECRKRDKVRSFFSSSNPVVHRPKIACKIKDVMSSIEGVLAESNQIGLQEVINSPPPHLKEKRSTEPFIDDSEIVGRDDDTSKVINMLVSSGYEIGLPVITILGMGGQGKTTLAQLVCKNDKIQSYFDKRAWVCVSDGDFNIERLLAQMLVSLKVKGTEHQPTNAEALVDRLKEELSGKRYLLVLDDVWNEDVVEWDRMRRCLQEIGGSKGSKVLATTRSELVAKAMHTSEYHWLKVLSEEQSWKLFEKWAFADGGAEKSPQLLDISKRILKMCGGVPLAIRVMGGLLYSKNCESEWSMIERSELWRASGEGNRVFSAIKLSYDHLPSLALKQCFAYCAIFQKDTKMQKDELIQLWMAQGLLNPPKGSDLQMEDMGSTYFNSLLRSSLLEDVEKVGYDNIRYCRMHDLVHDVSLQMSKNYCFHVKDWKDVDDGIKAVHLSIIASEGDLSKSFKGIVPPKLRTLHLKGSSALVDLFANFKCLTVLILEDENMEKLPNSIRKMKHLRLFDISSCRKISKLPNWITELYYLQTLKVYELDKVPKGFWKLINLRHFCICGFIEYSVPKLLIPRLSQLTNLQSLPFYKVDKSNGCQIEELEHLDNLKGTLRIYCLQKVRTGESALKSNLSRKSKVQTLYLHWDGGRKENCDDSGVMEGLKPHSNLKSLRIEGYQSPKFPSWMVVRNGLKPLLSNLVKLILKKLKKCEQLPSLGDLPCLEHLEIHDLENVRCIGEEFYGWANMDWVKKSNCSNGSQITLFPSLKLFKLSRMWNLVEWSDAIVPAYAHSSSVEVFPVLEKMEIMELPELCSFPNLGCLRKLQRLDLLKLNKCEQLPSLGDLPFLEHLEIHDLEKVRCIGEEFYGWRNMDWVKKSNCSNGSQITLFPSLKLFQLRWMRNLVEWSDAIVPAHAHSSSVEVFPVLEKMEIMELPELCSFPNLGCLRKLQRLGLLKLNKCEQLPSLGDLPCLEHLEIGGLDNVRCIGEEFYGWRNMDRVKKSNCSNGSQITLFPSLKLFHLRWMRNLVEWSDAIVPAHAHSSSVEVFPVLEKMRIEDLPQLCSFPNLGCLPKLRRLSIWDCPCLTTLPSNWNGVGTYQKSEMEDERAAASTHDSCVVSSASVGVGPSSSFCPPHDDLLLVNVPNVHYLPSLRHVTLHNCDEFCSLKILAPLKSLEIWCKVSLWPKDLHHLINLRSLELGGNRYAPEEEVDCFPFPFSISNVNVTEVVPYFPSLRDLTLAGEGLPNVTCLPDQIQYLTSLTDLTIKYFDRLESLPEWLGNLTSLQKLTVVYCGSLKQLPSAEAFQRLTNLKRLYLLWCSNYLKEACNQGSGSEWPKIAPLIPNLEVHISRW